MSIQKVYSTQLVAESPYEIEQYTKGPKCQRGLWRLMLNLGGVKSKANLR